MEYLNLKTILVVMVLLISMTSHAEITTGIQADIALISTPDSQGETQDQPLLIPSLIATYPLGRRDKNASLGLSYYSYSLEAGTNKVGQNVSGYSIHGAYSQRIPISRKVKNLWGSVGLRFYQLDRSDRHTIDKDGYLKDSFGKDVTGGMSLLFSGDYEFIKSKNYSLSAGIFSEYSLGDSLSSYGITVKNNF